MLTRILSRAQLLISQESKFCSHVWYKMKGASEVDGRTGHRSWCSSFILTVCIKVLQRSGYGLLSYTFCEPNKAYVFYFWISSLFKSHSLEHNYWFFFLEHIYNENKDFIYIKKKKKHERANLCTYSQKKILDLSPFIFVAYQQR